MSAKRCETWGGHAELYLTDDLTGRQRWLFEEHLALCPACREELGRFEDLFRRLRDLPECVPPKRFERIILEDVCPEPDAFAWLPHRHRIRRGLVAVFSLAASAAFVIAGRELFGRILSLTLEGTAPAAQAAARLAVAMTRGLVQTAQFAEFAARIGGKFLPLLETVEILVRQVQPAHIFGGLGVTGLATYLLARLVLQEAKGGVSHVRLLP
jgi:hypothetical protein